MHSAGYQRVRSVGLVCLKYVKNEIDWRVDHHDPEVRLDAIDMLESQGGTEGALGQILRNDPDPDVRIAAAEALETSESPEAIEVLLSALDDSNPEVVVAAIETSSARSSGVAQVFDRCRAIVCRFIASAPVGTVVRQTARARGTSWRSRSCP